MFASVVKFGADSFRAHAVVPSPVELRTSTERAFAFFLWMHRSGFFGLIVVSFWNYFVLIWSFGNVLVIGLFLFKVTAARSGEWKNHRVCEWLLIALKNWFCLPTVGGSKQAQRVLNSCSFLYRSLLIGLEWLWLAPFCLPSLPPSSYSLLLFGDNFFLVHPRSSCLAFPVLHNSEEDGIPSTSFLSFAYRLSSESLFSS